MNIKRNLVKAAVLLGCTVALALAYADSSCSPGTGKTTISKEVAKCLKAVYLRVDTIEQTLKNLKGYPDSLVIGSEVIPQDIPSMSLFKELLSILS